MALLIAGALCARSSASPIARHMPDLDDLDFMGSHAIRDEVVAMNDEFARVLERALTAQ